MEKLCEQPKYADFSKETFDMILTEAQKIGNGRDPSHPCRRRQGRLHARRTARCHVPKCFHRPYKLFCEGGWIGMSFPARGRRPGASRAA
ncbi:MAG: hypothetical protein MZU95_14850 [Desulfomicrobium escambiense]|nr:hypothetical protein [Desulfomicrobium escambiense]